MLLNVIFNSNSPAVSVTEVHGNFVVHGKGFSLGIAMVEMSSLLHITGGSAPLYN